MIKGIDVSSWQGDIDFEKVKQCGIDFVILRAGYGRDVSQKDSFFEQNYKNQFPLIDKTRRTVV